MILASLYEEGKYERRKQSLKILVKGTRRGFFSAFISLLVVP